MDNLEMTNTGRQTEITPKVREVADSISGEGEILIKNISDYIKSMDEVKNAKEPDFRRTSDEILKENRYNGCNEAGEVFASLLRAKGIPTIYIEALNKNAVLNYSHQNPNLVGHIFLEVNLDGHKKIVNSTTGEITDEIPGTYVEAARGLDSWDIGLNNGFDDLRKMFEKEHERLQ